MAYWEPDKVNLLRPPRAEGYALWGFFFPSAVLTDEENELVEAGLRRQVEERVDFNAGIWDQRDPEYRKVMRAFGITRPPALTLTKPWFGEYLRNADWASLVQKAERGEMPVHAIIQGREAFTDVARLLDIVGQLDIMFGEHDAELERSLRKRRLNEVGQNIASWTGGVLKNIEVGFGVGPAQVTLSFNKNGTSSNSN